jgi:2-polyprenyl-3-methyl-5-hydroxy-6-metoxy-1,4-benzoquinol methylase
MIKVLEHIDHPLSFIKKGIDTLKNQGCLIIVVPNAYSENRFLAEEMGLIHNVMDLNQWDIAQGHKHIWNQHTFEDLVIQFNNECHITIGGLGYKPLTNQQMELLPYRVLKTWAKRHNHTKPTVLYAILKRR